MIPWMGAGAMDGFPATVLMWGAMTAAMMVPTTVPWAVVLVRLTPGDAASRARLMALFLLGYALVWGAFSVVAAGAQSGLRQGGLILAGGALPPWLGGGVLVGAGLFQLTPLKDACLSRCRSPVSFFLERWSDGPGGAVRMGVAHGRYCLGCCWALMLSGLALGVMNLMWMAVLAGVMWAEKILPGGPRIGRAAGWLGVAVGAWLVASG